MNRYRRISGPILATLLLVAVPATVQAQDLPDARELVDRYVEAVGGRDLLLRDAPTRATGSFELPSAGLQGDLVVVTAGMDRMASKVTIPGMGDMLSGYTGEVGWSFDPVSGARLLDGGELAAMVDQADRRAALRDPALVESLETVERTEMAGEPCYRVAVVWKSGRESTDCYHVESGLLVATSATQESPMGSVEVTSTLSDYREMAGLLMPTRVVQDMMGMQQIMTIDSMEVGDVDTTLLTPPAPIRELIDARESGSGS